MASVKSTMKASHTKRHQGGRQGANKQAGGTHHKPPMVGARHSMPAHGGKKGNC